MRLKPKIEDPLFGLMTLVDDETCFQGRAYFSPLKTDIVISINTKSWGPTEEQRSLYKEIELRYFECIDKIPSLLEKAIPNRSRPISSMEFQKEFELQQINSREISSTRLVWELEFIIDGLDGWIVILFNNWKPSGLWVDE